jgi:hypothetical protein
VRMARPTISSDPIPRVQRRTLSTAGWMILE